MESEKGSMSSNRTGKDKKGERKWPASKQGWFLHQQTGRNHTKRLIIPAMRKYVLFHRGRTQEAPAMSQAPVEAQESLIIPVQKQLHHLGVLILTRDLNRIAPVMGGHVCPGSVLKEQCGELDVAILGCNPERSLSTARGLVHSRTMTQKNLSELCVAVLDGDPKRGGTVVRDLVYVSTALQK
eukprot:RCo015224